ncbi:MAG: hypothetical protein AMXMBFR47_37350 [Planctomycetota bacterium]
MRAALRQSPVRLSIAIIIALAALASLLFTFCYVWEGRARIVLSRGCLTLQWITESGPGTFGPTWEEIDNGDSPDWRRSHVFWNPGAERWLPQLHREHESPLGTWWTLSIPLWLPLCILLSWAPLTRQIYAARQLVCTRDTLRRRILTLCWLIAFVAAAAWLLATRGWLVYDNGVGTQYTVSDGALWTLSAEPGEFPYLGMSPFLHARWVDGNSYRFVQFLCPHTESNAVSTWGTWSAWVMPLWLPLVPPLALILALRRRSPPGSCLRCGYNLTGNVSGRCPECGTLLAPRVCYSDARARSPVRVFDQRN